MKDPNMNLSKLYDNRFEGDKKAEKNQMWQILCDNFFSKYVGAEDIVLDVAAGYCDFINHIQCKQKFAVDLNPDTQKYANPDVHIYLNPSTDMTDISDESMDVAFVSNFFEHLESKDALLQTLREINRVLKPNGRLLVLQPNIRFVYREYWDFVDHLLPISDRSLQEALELTGYRVAKMVPQFLPYTTKSKLPKADFFIELYLKVPIAWKILGKQCFAVAIKNSKQ